MVTQKILYEAPNWNQIFSMLLELSHRVCSSGFKPDVIVGVCRGGWIPARILSDLMENVNLTSVKVEYYLGIGQARSRPVLTQQLSADISGKKVLVVDEVADSGASLTLVTAHVLEQGAQELKTATLYCKPKCSFKPDYCAKTTDSWVVFPWEIKETLREILEANKADPAQTKRELARLSEAGVPQGLIAGFLKEFSELSTC
ncbi:MAG: phosphoribosyltransferase [Candidatus Bathyarchaeota archaeon]|nr:phosphoribosyltransferase [Candidatus Bathyarchaeota archaeon]